MQFTFDEEVAVVFDDMLQRSVPFYSEVQRMLSEQAMYFAQPESAVYDLGCATATTLIGLAKTVTDASINLIGVDNSKSILEKAAKKISEAGLKKRIELRRADLNAPLSLDRASVVICNLTLQFVRPLFRDTLIRSIYEGLLEGGCLLLVEKVLGEESMINRMFIDFYYDFKRRNGYSEMEIAAKREALENVLIPYKMEEDLTLLRRNGFELVDTFFKWYNFSGILAVKHRASRGTETD
ncbi:MAG: carboxy-S-adenosyl-L-methionine synthase CmoA [Deltaproteobacteria bacterium]